MVVFTKNAIAMAIAIVQVSDIAIAMAIAIVRIWKIAIAIADASVDSSNKNRIFVISNFQA